jgi:hypothetical protein
VIRCSPDLGGGRPTGLRCRFFAWLAILGSLQLKIIYLIATLARTPIQPRSLILGGWPRFFYLQRSSSVEAPIPVGLQKFASAPIPRGLKNVPKWVPHPPPAHVQDFKSCISFPHHAALATPQSPPVAELHSAWWVRMHTRRTKKSVVLLRFLPCLHSI